MYVHNASTDKYTLQVAHQKRGLEALEDIGLLKEYCGTIVSDHLSSLLQIWASKR
ncbi:MAG: hypothetical protein ACLKAK_13165 [Alkaliphilus sp.]